ncbi:MAG TPA: LacI family DNA-binding transcriptional regulator [Verrucomicrobiae bacterium]|nr:LacI family DNA-binding transcriptional regulator [Verrucomicrobiae bacterium]
MSKRVSIRDVARLACVSHTTVSLALRKDPRITTEVKQRVEKAADHLGYHPHAVVSDLMAQLRSLKYRAETATLGFITAWPTRDGWKESSNHRRFYEGVKRRALEVGYNVDSFWLREPGMTSRRMSRILYTRSIRGLILLSLPKAHGHLSLEWQYFAAVTKGLTIFRPKLHRVISSHYEDMQLVVHQLRKLGYRRYGLVLSADQDERTDRAWLAAYLLHQHDSPACDRVPAMVLNGTDDFRKFSQWYIQNRPEAILFAGVPIPAWVAELKLRVPEEVGLVVLDWSEEDSALAGIDADGEAQGMAAVDLLIGQLHAHEYSIPKKEKIVAVRGRWIDGRSLFLRR